MKTILVLGAGRSSSSLISYLIKEAEHSKWVIIVGDLSEASARERIGNSTFGNAISFNINDHETSTSAIAQADVVISLLPANLYVKVAAFCLTLNKHLLTASYVSTEMKTLDAEARFKGLLFLNECGLDPGVDHMSAMQIIDKIKTEGGKIISFESFTGGLIAPETDPQNPWRYKFTWNPRNVVMAGQATAKFLQEGAYKYIPYQQLFSRTTSIHVPGHGDFEGYANRDSLKYIETYGLDDIETMLRGTLRNKGFCSAWNVFVLLGCCDDTYLLDDVSRLTHRDFINLFLPHQPKKSIEENLAEHFGITINNQELQYLTWSGLFDETPVGLNSATPAQILEHILNKKWQLQPKDKDLVVMWHRLGYLLNGEIKKIQSSLVVKGDDAVNTAMAKTVGLPLAIAAKLLLHEKISQRGVVIPTSREFYEPILAELALQGIAFS